MENSKNIREFSLKKVPLVKTGTETSSRDEIGKIMLQNAYFLNSLFFAILLFSLIIHCVAKSFGFHLCPLTYSHLCQ